METLTPTPRTTLKRRPKRGSYERATVHAILDEGLVCHVGFALGTQPFVMPMAYVRDGEHIYLHGSPANRTLRALVEGGDTCINVMLVDALVISRSASHHSMNFRSVTVFGRAREVTDLAEKEAALRALIEHVVPGRWSGTRAPNPDELRHTLVVRIPIEEASAKMRTGGPVDDEADYALPVWAGEIPLRLIPGDPIDDPHLNPGTPVPAHVKEYRGPAAKGGQPWSPASES